MWLLELADGAALHAPAPCMAVAGTAMIFLLYIFPLTFVEKHIKTGKLGKVKVSDSKGEQTDACFFCVVVW